MAAAVYQADQLSSVKELNLIIIITIIIIISFSPVSVIDWTLEIFHGKYDTKQISNVNDYPDFVVLSFYLFHYLFFPLCYSEIS